MGCTFAGCERDICCSGGAGQHKARSVTGRRCQRYKVNAWAGSTSARVLTLLVIAQHVPSPCQQRPKIARSGCTSQRTRKTGSIG